MLNPSSIILTPIAPGTVIPSTDLGVPRVFSEMGPVAMEREVNINVNRARLQSIYRNKLYAKYKFVYLIDSDVVVTKETLAQLADAWKQGTTPCALTKQSASGHVVCSCCYLAGVDYLKVDYTGAPRECQCYKLPNPFYVQGCVGSEV